MKARNPSRKQFILFTFILFLLVFTISLAATSRWIYQRGMNKLYEEGAVKLELYVTYLLGVLKTYESLPELLAIDKKMVSALQNPNEEQRIETLNRYLATINSISDTADTYLMDKKGLTIAASNWQEEHPFVGSNFSYRPYFVEAMKGQLGRYFALGTTSSRRGYYFAYPVRKDNDILGVVVIKVNIDSVEQGWGHRDESFIVSDPDGVVFITTNPDWRYQTLQPLDDNVRERIIASRRYPNATLSQLTEVKKTLSPNKQIVQLRTDHGKLSRNHLLLTRHMPEAGWNVHILAATRHVRTNVLWVNVMVSSVLILAYLLFILLMQRRYRLGELTRMKENARLALQDANEKLEMRVMERTRELTEMNKLLRREIEDRHRTEVALKEARHELVHAAKLAALGQMSAGINHELNQPLAAIRSYTDNGKQFLRKGRLDDALWNLEQIGELTERMAQIGVQLKLFSRKASGKMEVVPLHGVIDGALEILKPSISKSLVTVTIRLEPENIEVRANNVLLQQVFVNVIGNAIQAVDGRDVREVVVVAGEREDKVVVTISDSGPGISQNDLSQIFDPFFTTKKSGQGLGLGLTISDRILRDMEGEIRAKNISRGACFEISLDRAT